MKRLSRSLFCLLGAFVFLTISSVCYAEYFWTIQKSSEKNMITIPMGEQVEVLYTVVVGVVEDNMGDCIDCAIPATLDQCVLVSEADGTQIGRVCARRNMMPTAFKYVSTIGPYDECGYYTVSNTVYLESVPDTSSTDETETCCDTWTVTVKVACDAPAPEQYQGCSKGYWKNHMGAWLDTAYEPYDLIGDVFNIPDNRMLARLKNDTLIEALNYNGGPSYLGGAKILIRHSVAALLNASHPAIYYPATPDRIILNVNDALETLDKKRMLSLKDMLENYNNMGCPLDNEEHDD